MTGGPRRKPPAAPAVPGPAVTFATHASPRFLTVVWLIWARGCTACPCSHRNRWATRIAERPRRSAIGSAECERLVPAPMRATGTSSSGTREQQSPAVVSFEGRQICRQVVHVGVRVDREQFAMSLERVANLDASGSSPLRRIVRIVPSGCAIVTRKSSRRTRRPSTFSPAGKVTVAVTRCGPRAGRHRRRARSPGRPTPTVLQHRELGDTCRDALKVTSGRMTAGAVRGEERRPGIALADQDVQHDRLGARRFADRAACGLQRMKIHGHRLHIGLAHGNRHHDRPGAPVLDHREDELTVLIVQHELRSQEVRPTELATTRIDAVAGAARADIQAAPALDYRRVGGRALLRREPRVTVAGRRRSTGLWRASMPLNRRPRRGRRCLRRRLRGQPCDDDQREPPPWSRPSAPASPSCEHHPCPGCVTSDRGRSASVE